MATELGFGSIEQLAGYISEGVTRILLVTGRKSFDHSGAADALDEILAPYIVTRFKEFSPNPDWKEVDAGTAICNEVDAELVIAVGGGSALDMGKLICRNDPTLLEAAQQKHTEIQARPTLPLIAIPTTAGSGSEATHFAVAYVNGEKHSIASEAIRPRHVIVDPALTRSMSPELTAVTGMDALCQAIESYWAVGATDASRDHAKMAMGYLLPNLEKAVLKPDDEAREAMCLGAHWAGKAIDISKTTGAHAMSYGMTQLFDIPHGHAVALTLGHFMVYNSQVQDDDCQHPDGAEVVRQNLKDLWPLLGADSAPTAQKAWLTRMETVGLKTRISACGADAEKLHELVAKLNFERAGNNPRLLNANSAREIYRAAW